MLLNREGQGSLRAYLVQGAAWSFALKIASTGLVFITSIVLARVLGAEGYGIYAYAMALVGLLGIPASLGLPQLVLRNIAVYQTRSEWGLMRGLLRRANQVVLLTSLGLGVIALLVSLVLRDHLSPAMLAAFWLALSILPLVALNGLRTSTLRGLGFVVLGQLPGSLVRPFSFLALVVLTYLLLGNRFNASWAVSMQVGATAIALGFVILILARRLPKAMKESLPAYDTQTWVRSALPFLFIGGMQIINNQTDIVMLGALRGAEVVGIYRAATRVAQLVVFVLTAANVVLQPTIARLYAVRDMQRVQHIATQSARVILLVSVPIAVVLIAFGQWILLAFGQEFTKGATALAILSGGQLVNAAMGSVGLLLNMTGHERDTARGVGIAAVVNVALNAILIPLWGINGAAIATATSLVVWNLILAMQVVRRLDIYPTAFGRMGSKRRV
jgi:O-antigen/teichoic acid export membrane protein